MKKLFGLSLFFILSACQEYPEKMLVGEWRGATVLEEGMPMPIEPGEVGFEFYPSGQYLFRSTLNYQEAGSYSIRGGLLYTLDTLNEASTEKAVKILALTEDSLFLKMNADGKERIVKLAKTN